MKNITVLVILFIKLLLSSVFVSSRDVSSFKKNNDSSDFTVSSLQNELRGVFLLKIGYVKNGIIRITYQIIGVPSV
jgi:hypothetical protein